MSAIDPDAPPRGVVTAYWLYLASAALNVVNLIVSIVVLPTVINAAIARALEQSRGRDTGGVDVEAIARGAAIGGVALGSVLTLVFVVLTIVFARKMLRGRNWARIVLAVFAALRLFGVVGIGGSGALVALLTGLEVVVIALAAILTFMPVSNVWFRSMRPVRAPF